MFSTGYRYFYPKEQPSYRRSTLFAAIAQSLARLDMLTSHLLEMSSYRSGIPFESKGLAKVSHTFSPIHFKLRPRQPADWGCIIK